MVFLFGVYDSQALRIIIFMTSLDFFDISFIFVHFTSWEMYMILSFKSKRKAMSVCTRIECLVPVTRTNLCLKCSSSLVFKSRTHCELASGFPLCHYPFGIMTLSFPKIVLSGKKNLSERNNKRESLTSKLLNLVKLIINIILACNPSSGC